MGKGKAKAKGKGKRKEASPPRKIAGSPESGSPENVSPENLSPRSFAKREEAEAKERKAKLAADIEALVNMYGRFIVSKVKSIQRDYCWAVSSAEILEGSYNCAIEDRTRWLSLSPQHMINSIELQYDAIGSFRKMAKFLTDEGLCKEEVCPYTGKKGTFQKHLKGMRVVIEGDVDQNSGINEEKIIGLLNERKGPVVIVFNGDFSFSELKAEEIYTPPEGTKTLRPHGVALVGYGTTNEEPFWTIRNSYGAEWCNNGYGKISRKTQILKLWYPKKTRSK